MATDTGFETDLRLAPDMDRSIMPAVSVALLILITVALVVFLVNPRETSAMSVEKVQILAPHTEFKAFHGAGQVLDASPQSEDDLYVVATISVTDKIRLPLFLTNATVTLTSPDGSAVEATAISPRYYQRLEASFPALTPMLGTPIYDGDEISPGETRRGCFLVLFPGATDEIWRNKKSAVLTLNLRNQAPQTITLQ
jgi:hypothetical protein